MDETVNDWTAAFWSIQRARRGLTPGLPTGMKYALEVEGLQTYFYTKRGGMVKAVDGVSVLRWGRGETLGIVGESGCGKSITALSLLRLVPTPAGQDHRRWQGSCWRGGNLLELRRRRDAR